MGPTIFDVSTVPEFMAAVKNAPVAAPIFVLFLANLDLQTGNSWCPDTVESYPVVMKVFNEETDKQTVLIRVQCGDRLTWRNPENPFHWEPFHIRSVPTLSRWYKGMLQGRSLVDYEPSVEYLVKRFISGSTFKEGDGQLEGA